MPKKLVTVVCFALLVIGFAQIGGAQVAGGIPLDMSKLVVPPGFQISIYAQTPSPARNILFLPDGRLLVSLMFDGVIATVTPDGHVSPFISGLYNPTGLALRGNDLYVAEMTQVNVFHNLDPNQRQVIIPNLPDGDHFTRNMVFGPDDKLYLGIGSDCNLCIEETPRRAEIMRFNPDGSGEEVVATGIRNPVGLRFNPTTHQLWSTDLQFDHMGDDVPPDKLEIIRQGGNYGWPYCYGSQIPNPMFPPTWSPSGDPNYCASTLPPAMMFQAHSAPLGLEFYTAGMFPPEYQGDAFVTFHGSYDRTVPTGYKIVHIKVQGGLPVSIEDFATGWLDGSNTRGRPGGYRAWSRWRAVRLRRPLQRHLPHQLHRTGAFSQGLGQCRFSASARRRAWQPPHHLRQYALQRRVPGQLAAPSHQHRWIVGHRRGTGGSAAVCGLTPGHRASAVLRRRRGSHSHRDDGPWQRHRQFDYSAHSSGPVHRRFERCRRHFRRHHRFHGDSRRSGNRRRCHCALCDRIGRCG